MNDNNTMSKELQEKADRMIRELTDSLTPIKDEMNSLRKSIDRIIDSHTESKTR